MEEREILLPEEEIMEESIQRRFVAGESAERLDVFLARQNGGELSRSQVQRVISEGGCWSTACPGGPITG